MSKIDIGNLKITIIYDNKVWKQGLEPAWGFACLVEGLDKTLLFDTGGDGEILMRNMAKLGIKPGKVDAVFLSHEHWDHVGGLERFLKANPAVTVYLLSSFSGRFMKKLRACGARVMQIAEPIAIGKHALSTGQMGEALKEQALLIPTAGGLVVLTGCAHPGVVKIVTKAKALTGQEVLLVMGGFHLLDHSDAQAKKIVATFKKLGVKYAAPCHCTGDKAIGLFRDEYGERFVEIGAGGRITQKDLQVDAERSWGMTPDTPHDFTK